ncbi:DNA topoisomerase 2-binding protein 1 [Parelaphostrongylus tenuis]|uniref:DNA topoisomerase 2-binding protein 1 n=1 Tax=Parelaphostrongylus tenuis TaxID=148309 RepID=A0AAD5NC00_PARTN|nr:DNA topoisomerase 2-binding protein 1 [Parelaphostrongylus tenuis]
MHDEKTANGISLRGDVTMEPTEKYLRVQDAANMDAKPFNSNPDPVGAVLPQIRSAVPSTSNSIGAPAGTSSADNAQLNPRYGPESMTERTEQAKPRILPHAKEASQSKMPIGHIPSVKQERISIVVSGNVRRFIFTSVLPQERLRLSNIIERLGGIADPGELNDDCTHLICGKLIRGSKLMGCIASGKWVVAADYVDRSLDAGTWLSETDFEVGSPSRLSATNLSERELKLAQACRRWRIKLANTDPSKRVGAFHKWRCLLYCSDEKAAGLIPMLKSGGAEVVVRKNGEGAPLTFRPTHAVVCSCNMWNMEELEELVSIGAKVFHLDYISKFLLDEHVDESASYHTDYKKYLQKHGK